MRLKARLSYSFQKQPHINYWALNVKNKKAPNLFKVRRFLFKNNIMESLLYETVKGLNREWSKTLMV